MPAHRAGRPRESALPKAEEGPGAAWGARGAAAKTVRHGAFPGREEIAAWPRRAPLPQLRWLPTRAARPAAEASREAPRPTDLRGAGAPPDAGAGEGWKCPPRRLSTPAAEARFSKAKAGGAEALAAHRGGSEAAASGAEAASPNSPPAAEVQAAEPERAPRWAQKIRLVFDRASLEEAFAGATFLSSPC